MGRWQLLWVHGQLLFVAMVWGGQFVALRMALRELRVADMLLLRTILAAAFYAVYLGILAWRSGHPPRLARADWGKLAIVALLGVPGGGVGVMAAQRFISADVASLLTVLGPVFTAFAAYLLLGQRLTRRQAGGIALAIGGFLIILFLGGKGARFEVGNMIGVLLMASSPFFFAFYTVLCKPLVMRHGAAAITGLVMLVGVVYLAPLASRQFARNLLALSGVGWGAALFCGLIATGLSYLLWNRGLHVLQPAQVAVYIYLVPVFGVLTAALVLGDRPTPWAALGGLTILAGVIVTNLGARRGALTADTMPAEAVTPADDSPARHRSPDPAR